MGAIAKGACFDKSHLIAFKGTPGAAQGVEYPGEICPALTNAPHTAELLVADEWSHPYKRQEAAYPNSVKPENKYWSPVARVDNAYGDRNLICTCLPVEAYEERN